MTIDVKNMSEKELIRLQKDVDKALARIKDQKRSDAKKAAAAAAGKFGYTLSDLVGTAAKAKPVKSKPGKPKYRNPADKSQTWTGRGRQPGWIKDALKAGKSLDDMAI